MTIFIIDFSSYHICMLTVLFGAIVNDHLLCLLSYMLVMHVCVDFKIQCLSQILMFNCLKGFTPNKSDARIFCYW